MKILLLRLPVRYRANKIFDPAGYISSLFYCQWLTRYPPLGLLYTASLLKQRGHTVRLIDAEFMGYSLNRVLNISKDFKPNIICSSVNIFSPRFEFDCLKTLKENLEFTLICRGHFPRLYPAETIQNKHVDFALTGKGFNSICPLIETIEQKKEFDKVPGIIYREGEKIIKTPKETPFNLNHLPFPARELIDNSIYTTALTTKDKFTTLMGSTGCPYSCTYCADKNIPFQTRDVDNIIKELQECKYKFGINEVFFFDLIFNINRRRTIEFCNKLLKKGLKIKWVFRTRPDLIDEKLLDILAESGCVKIHYGIESGDQQTLDRLKRQIKLNQIEKAVRLTYKKKIAVLGYFMIGNDGETQNTVMKTISLAKSLPFHFVQFMKVYPIPHSDILKNSKEKLKIDPWLENYKGTPLSPEQWKPQNTSLSSKEITSLVKKAYRCFYLRPTYLWRLLTFKYTPFYIFRQFKIMAIIIRLNILNKLLLK